VATFAGCTVDKAGTYSLTATDGTLASATSGSFTVVAGAASKLIYVTDATGSTNACPTGTVIVGNGGKLTAFVAVADASGNLALAPGPGITIAITRVTGDGLSPSPASLAIAAGSNVTGGSSDMKLPNGSPADTTYTATAPGYAGVSCIVKK